jgi:hypothetical protein
MSDWITRYEEGYLTTDGESITLTDELHREHPWRSPAEAQAHWSKREDLASLDMTTSGNGFQQTDDVRTRRAFAELGVVAIWRRVTFVPFGAP